MKLFSLLLFCTLALAQETTPDKIAIASKNAFFESSDHREMTLVYCKVYQPKPQGCEILKGKTLDDLMDAVLFFKSDYVVNQNKVEEMRKKCGASCR